MKENEKNWEENWEESTLIQIGAKVPGEFAKIFTAYCRQHRFVNQRELFYNLACWWYLQNKAIQEHICRGRIPEALSRISEESRGRTVVRRAKAQTTEPKQKSAQKSSRSA